MRLLRGPLIIAGIVGLVTLFALSEPGARFLAGVVQSPHSVGPEVGRILSFEGQIKRVREGDVEIFAKPLDKPLTVYSRDRIEVDGNSKALLQLNSNDEFELLSLTSVALQLWNERDASSAVYLVLNSGDAELKKAGVKGKAYVVRDGRLYSPGQKVSAKPMALTVLKSAPLDIELGSEGKNEASTDFQEDPQQEDAEPQSLATEPETLSNEYIDEMVASRQSQLQKCWISRLKDNPELKGQVILQFEINRRGKVKEIRVADSTFEDDGLKKCAMSVIERINFRTFKGSEISLTYPITFE